MGAATKNATCEIIVSLVGRRRCQIHTDTHTQTYIYAEVVVVAVFVAVAVRPTPFASCVKARWQHNLRY